VNISNVKIDEIFEKIRIDLGIQKKTTLTGIATDDMAIFGVHEEYQPYLAIKEQKFAVLFNLDISGSMAGSKWTKVCQSVDKFVRFLGEGDLVAGVVFNDKIDILTKPSQQKALPPPTRTYQPTPTRYQPSQPIYQPQPVKPTYNYYQEPSYERPSRYSIDQPQRGQNCCAQCNIF